MVRKATSADIPKFALRGDTSTQTIDFGELFSTDLSETGTFDLRAIQSTALGKLLDAVPTPALLVTDQCHVIFGNKACERLGGTDSPIVGSSFLDFLPRLDDDDRSRVLATKAQAVFKKAFETRKPHQTEAILRIGKSTKWFRLHLHCVRMVERYIMVILEDLTHEKVRLRVNEREEHRLRNTVVELRRWVSELTAELEAAREDLRRCGSVVEPTPDFLHRRFHSSAANRSTNSDA